MKDTTRLLDLDNLNKLSQVLHPRDNNVFEALLSTYIGALLSYAKSIDMDVYDIHEKTVKGLVATQIKMELDNELNSVIINEYNKTILFIQNY